MHDGLMFGMGWLWIVGLILVVAVIWAVARVASGLRPGGAPPREPTPEQVLRDRLARGEIDLDEYRSRSRALHEGD